ncbi:hypothetical protein EYF80_003423 [Liparis tanakae]|uniref:Uncharacterized protein n=1 Tax=Liparis tanakae TaxID=230148 RepID=A0A4Z2J9I4_9TELE|nr:hypothetical protein EYF80_003423 [Liparis tanakae]
MPFPGSKDRVKVTSPKEVVTYQTSSGVQPLAAAPSPSFIRHRALRTKGRKRSLLSARLCGFALQTLPSVRLEWRRLNIYTARRPRDTEVYMCDWETGVEWPTFRELLKEEDGFTLEGFAPVGILWLRKDGGKTREIRKAAWHRPTRRDGETQFLHLSSGDNREDSSRDPPPLLPVILLTPRVSISVGSRSGTPHIKADGSCALLGVGGRKSRGQHQHLSCRAKGAEVATEKGRGCCLFLSEQKERAQRSHPGISLVVAMTTSRAKLFIAADQRACLTTIKCAPLDPSSRLVPASSPSSSPSSFPPSSSSSSSSSSKPPQHPHAA